MKKLVVLGLILSVTSCGDSTQARKDVSTSKAGQSSQTTCDVQGINCTTVVIGDPVQSSATYSAGIPTSYTFLDTPDANLCVDAFTRQGIELPLETVARSFNSFNLRANGIAWQDMQESAIPVLNILHLESKYSNVVFQLLNPIGYYCIVKNGAVFSNVSIQRKCTAKIAEIEPMTHTTVNQPAQQGFFGRLLCWGRGNDELSGTTTSYNSSIQEVPCIP